MQNFGTLQQPLLGELAMSRRERRKREIARRTTGAECRNFLAGFLQVSHMFIIHLLKACSKSLKKSLYKLLTTN